MKKQNLFFLTLAALSVSLNACSSPSSEGAKKTGWDLELLKGKVKSIKIEEYDAVEKDGALEKTALWKTGYHTFDKDGHTISYVEDSPYGHAEMTCTYEQDKMIRKLDMDGDIIISEVTFTSWGDYQTEVCERWHKQTEYRYNDQQQLVEQKDYYEGDLESRMEYYDASGRDTKSVRYNSNGVEESTYYHTYNEQGDVIEYRVSRPYGELVNRYTYQSDDHGNYIRRECLSTNPNYCKIEECTIEYYE